MMLIDEKIPILKYFFCCAMRPDRRNLRSLLLSIVIASTVFTLRVSCLVYEYLFNLIIVQSSERQKYWQRICRFLIKIVTTV